MVAIRDEVAASTPVAAHANLRSLQSGGNYMVGNCTLSEWSSGDLGEFRACSANFFWNMQIVTFFLGMLCAFLLTIVPWSSHSLHGLEIVLKESGLLPQALLQLC